jgi:hypothetical protein
MVDPRLANLLAIPRGAADRGDSRWRDIETSLGLELPGSYKALIDQFGALSWGDFLHVLSPFDEPSSLQRVAERVLDADRESRLSFPWRYPLPLYPEPGGLLPWAVTENGDTLYFVTRGPADEWPTVVKGARAPEFEVHFLPPALIVHQIAVGSLRSAVLALA